MRRMRRLLTPTWIIAVTISIMCGSLVPLHGTHAVTYSCPANLTTIRFGQSVPLTGMYALDGMEFRDGILAAFEAFNQDTTINKRFQLDLQVLDDAGDATKAIANVQSFVSDPSVLAIIGLYTIPTTEAAAPIAFAKGIPVLAQYGGSQLRSPFQKYMLNVRVSYLDEARAIVFFLVNQRGKKRIALFAQDGSFGALALQGISTALDSNNLNLHSYAKYNKVGNTTVWTQDAIAAVTLINTTAAMTAKSPDAVVIAASYEPASIFIPKIRQAFPTATLICFSPALATTLVDLLDAQQTVNGNGTIFNNLYLSQVVPLPSDTSQRFVQKYQSAMTLINRTKWSFSSLEGFLMGELVIAGLERIRGFNFTSEALVKSIYQTSYFNLDGLRVGPYRAEEASLDGTEIGTGCNQGMRKVVITEVLPNKTISLAQSLDFETCSFQTKQWDTLYFGQSCTFSGSLQIYSCIPFRNGLLAAFKQINDAGGIRGTTRLKLITKDDHDNETLAFANNMALLADPQIFGLIGTSSLAVQQVAAQVASRPDKVMFAPFDGDRSLRIPFKRNIINFRASISDEIHAVVHYCYYQRKMQRIALIYHANAFGLTRRNVLVDALNEKRLQIYREVAYNSSNVTQAIAALFDGKGAKFQAVLFAGLDDSFADITVAVHNRSRDYVVFAISKVISTKFAKYNVSQVNWANVIFSISLPSYFDPTIEVVSTHFRALYALDSTMVPSFPSLEGFVVGHFLAIALNGIMGEAITVENMLKSAYDHGIFNMYGLRCGPLHQNDTSTGITTSCNQCMKMVNILTLTTDGSSTKMTPFSYDTCMYEPTTNLDFQLGSTRLIFLVLAGLGIVYTLVVMALLLRHRHNDHIRPISVRFSMVSCFGGILCYVGVFVLYPIPNDDICAVQPWLADLAFVTLFGPIFAKTYRIERLFNGKKMKHQIISDLQLFRVFLAMVVVFVVFLVVFTAVDKPHMQEHIIAYSRIRFEECTNKYSAFVQVDYGLKALVLLWGCFLCQRVSKISGQFARFNESKQMVLCIYHTTFLAICMLLIGITTSEAPNLHFACTCGLLIDNTVFVVSMLYTRPVYLAMAKAVVEEESDHSTESGTTSGSGGQRCSHTGSSGLSQVPSVSRKPAVMRFSNISEMRVAPGAGEEDLDGSRATEPDPLKPSEPSSGETGTMPGRLSKGD